MSIHVRAVTLMALVPVLGIGAYLALRDDGGKNVVNESGAPPPTLAPESDGQEEPLTKGPADGAVKAPRQEITPGGSESIEALSKEDQAALQEGQARLRKIASLHHLVLWPFDKLLRRVLSEEEHALAVDDTEFKASLYRLMDAAKIPIRQGLEKRGGKINELALGLVRRGQAGRYSNKPKGVAYLCEVATNGRTYNVWVAEDKFEELRTIRDQLAIVRETFVRDAARELRLWRKRRYWTVLCSQWDF